MLGNGYVLFILCLLLVDYRKAYREIQVTIILMLRSHLYSLILFHRAKPVYIGGLLFYSCGMTLMALTRAKSSVIVFSWAAGVMYSTLFTMPYLLIAHYHSSGVVSISRDNIQN